MRKQAFVCVLATAVVGVFGAFMRWLQVINGFEENGLAIPGAATAVAFVAYSLLAFIFMWGMAYIYLRRRSFPAKAAEALYFPNRLPAWGLWLPAAVMAVCGVVLMFSADFARFPTMQRVTGVLSVFAGVSLPFMLPKAEDNARRSSASAAVLLPVLFYGFWLVTDYRVNSEDPRVWGYAVGVLAIMAAAIAFYYVAAYFYADRAKPRRCLVALQMAVYLSMATLPDGHSGVETALYLMTVVVCLLMEFLVLDNMKEKAVEEPAEEEVKTEE